MTGAIPVLDDPERITPSWLSEVLGVEVVAIDRKPVGVGIGLTSLLYRLTPSYGSTPGPASVVLKMASRHGGLREACRGYGVHGREVAVYLHPEDVASLRPPRVHHAAHDPASDAFVLVIEDLAALRTIDQQHGCAIADARVVVEALASHHARWWEHDDLAEQPWLLDWTQPRFLEFNVESVQACWPVVADRFGPALPPRIRAIADDWSRVVRHLIEVQAGRPHTFVHGDLRIDNLLFRSGEPATVTAIDWQLAGRSPGANDLAYFVSQSLSEVDRRTHGPELLSRYYDTLRAHGVTGYSIQDLLLDHRRALLFCLFYGITVGAAELPEQRSVALAETMIRRSVAAILDSDADDLATEA